MVPPLIRLILREPSLFVDHLNAYADAVTLRVKQSWPLLLRVLVGWVLLIAGVMIGLILAGLSFLLYITSRRDELAYVLVPAVPLLVGLIGLVLVKATNPSAGFEQLKEELREDIRQLRLP
jgi:hypothetical protein